MRKILIFLSALGMLLIPVLSHAYNYQGSCFPAGLSTDVNPDTNDSTFTGITPATGDLYVKGHQYNYNPMFNPTLVWVAPEAASGTAYATITIATYTTTTNALLAPTTAMTLAIGSYTDVITPRNLVFLASSTYAGGTSYVKSSALVTGTDLFGNTQTETIAFSTSSTVPNYTGIGNRAWSSVTSVTITNSSCTVGNVSTLVYYMGSGAKLGLSAYLVNASSSTGTEVLKVIENKTLVVPNTWASGFNTTYQTYTPAAATDGSKNYVIYLVPKTR